MEDSLVNVAIALKWKSTSYFFIFCNRRSFHSLIFIADGYLLDASASLYKCGRTVYTVA